MNWLFPGFLAGALAIGVPIALHLLRRRPHRPVVFPSLRFLAPSSRRIERSWHRWRRWLVLALRCAIFALLAAAFARPYRGGELARQSRAVVVVIDNSFSLQAKGRWDALKRWSRQAIGTFAPGDQLGLLLMAPQPTWLVAPTTETARPLRALDELTPGWLTARAEPALRLAGDTLAAIPADRREIIVIGDHQRLSWSGTDFSQKLPPGVSVTFPDVPPAIDRQAAVLAPALTRTEQGILASVPVRNFTGPQKRILRVYRDGVATPLREETLDLGRQELRTVVINLPMTADRPAYFRFSLDEDDLPADDSAYAVWQPSGDGTLLLDAAPPGDAADFVATALTAAAGMKPSFRISPLPAREWPARAVAVLRNDSTFSGEAAVRLGAFLTGGGSALIFVGDGPDETAWLAAEGIKVSPLPEQSEPWRVHDWAMDHPLVAELSKRRLEVLLGWEFNRGWALPVDAVKPLGDWTDSSAAIGEARVGAGTVLICGFSPERGAGDWPVTPAFVPFLHQAAAYLVRTQQTATTAGQTGQALPLGGEEGQWRAIEGPAAAKPPVAAAGAVVPMAPGVYEFVQGPDRRLFAVNLPPEESDPAAWTAGTPWLGLVSSRPAAESKAPRAKLAAAEAEQKAPLWWWVVAAVAVLLLAELGLANRTAR